MHIRSNVALTCENLILRETFSNETARLTKFNRTAVY